MERADPFRQAARAPVPVEGGVDGVAARGCDLVGETNQLVIEADANRRH